MKPLPAWTTRLRQVVSPGGLQLDLASRKAHAGDKWFASHLPDAVVLAPDVDTVSRVLRFAHQRRIPVTTRGAGHGYVGGCVPVRGGIVLSVARLNRIKEINARDFVTVVEPGVITQTLQDKVEAKGLFYPPDPASRSECTIGGNIATNAGGPRCLKYGVTRDYVLGLEVVLANGEVARLGGRTHKNKTGFELARLFVGSEGLLGVVTEATLRLIPLPPARACLAAGFNRMASAVGALQAIFAAGLLPCALELADSFTLAAARKRTGSRLLEGCRAHLIVEVDGQTDNLGHDVRRLAQVVKRFSPRFIRRAYGAEGCEKIWQVRREFSYALRDTGLTKLNEDVVVPRGRLQELFRYVAQLQRRYRTPVAAFGHAGDGNIHVNIMVDPKDARAEKRGHQAVDALFRQVINWGGAITGEHGVGLAKKPWWPLAVSPTVLRLHRRLKQALDERNILNPGKFV